MNTNKEMFKSAFISGLILLGVFVVLDLIIYSFDLASYRVITSILSLSLMVFLFIYLGRNYRDDHFNGYISYGRSYAYILIAVLVYGVFYAIYNFLFYEYFDPSRLEELIKMQLTQMQDWGMDEDLIKEQESAIRAKMSAQSITLWSFVGIIGMGAVIGAFAVIFVKKKETISEVF